MCQGVKTTGRWQGSSEVGKKLHELTAFFSVFLNDASASARFDTSCLNTEYYVRIEAGQTESWERKDLRSANASGFWVKPQLRRRRLLLAQVWGLLARPQLLRRAFSSSFYVSLDHFFPPSFYFLTSSAHSHILATVEGSTGRLPQEARRPPCF